MKLALTKELLEQQTGWAELEVGRGVSQSGVIIGIFHASSEKR
jgi:hypothetical protein